MNCNRTDTKNVMNKIRGFARCMGKSRSGFAVEAGLDAKTLQDLWEDFWNPRASTLIKCEAVIPADFDLQNFAHLNKSSDIVKPKLTKVKSTNKRSEK